jgi:cytochrome c553
MKNTGIVAAFVSLLVGVSLLALPVPSDGEPTYTKMCLKCHGAQGKGDGPVAKMVKNQGMGDLSHKETMSGYSDEDLYKFISEGGEAVGKSKLMSAHKDKLAEAEIKAVIAYIKTLQK